MARTELLDEGFQDKLLQVVANNRLPSYICQALQDTSQYQRAGQRRTERRFIGYLELDSIWELSHRITWAILTYLSSMQRINMLGTIITIKRKASWREQLNRLIYDRSTLTEKRWPFVLLAVYLICIFLLVVNIYYQYVYDASIIRLERLGAQLNDTNNNWSNQQLKNQPMEIRTLQLELKHRAEEARRTLKWLGSSHIFWSFTIETIMLVYITSSVNVYLFMNLNYRTKCWPMYAARLLLDRNNESQARTQLILEEIQTFSVQSVSFFKTKLEQLNKSVTNVIGATSINGILDTRDPLVSYCEWTLDVANKRLRDQHSLTMDRLKMIALEGRLNPLNRTPACQDKLALYGFLGALMTTIYLELMQFNTYSNFAEHYRQQGIQLEHDNWKAVLNTVIMLLVLKLHQFSGTFVGMLMLLTWFDEINSMSRLELLIKHVVGANECRVYQLLNTTKYTHQQRLSPLNRSPIKTTIATMTTEPLEESPQTMMRWPTRDSQYHNLALIEQQQQQYHNYIKTQNTKTKLCQEIELDLMTIIIQCRLVRRSFELARQPMGLFAYYTIWVAAVLLLLVRLQNSYFHEELRAINLKLSVACALICYFYLFPLGIMHQRCIKTFKQLWTLRAQLSYFRTFPTINKCLEFDSNVAILSLSRELADSRQRMDRLAIVLGGSDRRILSFSITNQNLIRIAFWALLIIVSISSNMKLLGDGFAAFLNDPFGLFSFS